MNFYIIISFAVATFISFIIFKFSKYFHFIFDHTNGPQKFHVNPAPRVGGIALIIGIMATLIYTYQKDETFEEQYLLLILSSLPVFLSGITEDLTKKVSSAIRLSAAMLSAVIAFTLLNARVTRLDLPVDCLFVYLPVSFLFTIFAVAGVTNGINIIDGYNGLASMVSLLIFSAVGYVAYRVNDYFLLTFCLSIGGAILGFFMWNYPKGLIFLGDGGAYLLGFFIGETSVLLVNRHSEVSAWFSALITIYPVFETLFSIYRRKYLRRQLSTQADALHLHHLIHNRIVRHIVNPKNTEDKIRQNALTSPYLWLLSCITVIPAVLFWRKTLVLMLFFLIFIIVYLWLYRSIVKFKIPKMLFLNRIEKLL